MSDESAARQLLDRLKTEGWAVVDQWKADKEPETNHLEFKRKHDRATPTIDVQDIDEIAPSLSALGNTGGGLLVLGVDAGGAEKKGKGFDRVRAIPAIADVEAFGGALERRIRSFTEPFIAGLALHPVVRPGASDGVVVVLVPSSDGGPHRTAGASTEVNGRYHIRTGSASPVMPHLQLAAMFSRSAPCRLELVARFESFDTRALPMVELRLRNTGRGTARRPAVRLEQCPLDWQSMNGDERFYRRPIQLESGVTATLFEPREATLVLYPDDEAVIMRGRVMKDAYSDLGGTRVPLSAVLYALDAQPRRGTGTLTMGPYEHQEDALRRRVIVPGEDA